MPVFACRWGNGDVSFVMARNREVAIELLDEIANAERADLVVVPDFMIHLKLSETPQITQSFGVENFLALEGVGEATDDVLWWKLYPHLYEQLTAIWDEQEVTKRNTLTPEHVQRIRLAIEAARAREVGRKVVPEPETEAGKNIKKMLDAPSTVVNKMVKSAAKERLTKWQPPKGNKRH